MRTGSKLGMRLLLVAVAIVAMTATAAPARVLEILNGERGFRDTWGVVEFRESGGGAAVRCAMTLEGSFSRLTEDKTAGTSMKKVTAASVSGCTGGSVTVLTETLPWEETYDSFAGTLPNITSIRQRLTGASFRVRSTLATCLASSEVRNPLYLISATRREAGGLLEMPTLRIEEGQSIPLSGGFPCEFATGRLVGTANTTVQNETARLTVRLIEAVPTATLTPAVVEILRMQIVAEQKYVIRNTTAAGGGDIRIESIGLVDAVRFRVEDAVGRCNGRTLAPQATCQFEVNYNAAFETERPRTTGVLVTWDLGALGAFTRAQ